MARAGRKTKYDEATVRAITEALRLGMTRRDACIHGDISEDTFANWLARYSEFSDAVQKAEMQSKMSRLARITKAGTNGTWQADAWVLERKFPQEFAQRLVVQVTPEDAALLKKHGLTPGEAWQALMQQLTETTNNAQR